MSLMEDARDAFGHVIISYSVVFLIVFFPLNGHVNVLVKQCK